MSRCRTSRLGAALCGSLALAALTVPADRAWAATSELVAPTTAAMELDVGKGRLIRLTKPATSVFVADPGVADVQVKSPTLIYIFGKAGGTTNLYAVGDADEILLSTDVHVHYDVASIEQAIHEIVPRAAISVTAVADSLVLSGTASSPAEGDDIRRVALRFVKDPKQLINQMQMSAPDQVNIQVRVAEVDREIVKQFGINLFNAFNNGKIAFGFVSAGSALMSNGATSSTTTVAPYDLGSSTILFNTQSPSLVGGATSGSLYGGFATQNYSVNSVLDALDNHGLVTILAEPNLTALSGQPASFLAGGEFPIPVPAGEGLVGIDWKSFGVILNFVATITANDRISLHVAPEVSQLSTNGSIVEDGISVPSLTTRKAETTVEMASGQTFAIAGLLQNNITQQIDKFPWLGDVPVLGQLFRSEGFQRNETELVVLVTPYIVHPIATASQAAMPTDGYVPSTDVQFLKNGSEYQQAPPPAQAVPATSGKSTLVGPAGFDLE